MSYRSKEGYRDPTAGEAIKEVDKEPDNIRWLRKMFREVAGLLGYEIVGRVVVRGRKTKRTWR